MNKIPLFLAFTIYCATPLMAQMTNVLIWDERQPRQAEAYDNFLGNEIAARIDASTWRK